MELRSRSFATGAGREETRSRLALLLLALLGTAAQGQDRGEVRAFTIVAEEFAFSPTRIEVPQWSLVKINFKAVDVAHAFVIDDYRIARRARAGQTIVFEFRADRGGTFEYYCGLTADDRHRQMHGALVVRP